MSMVSISDKSQVLLILLSFVDHIYNKGNTQLQLKVSEHKDVTFHIQVHRPCPPKILSTFPTDLQDARISSLKGRPGFIPKAQWLRASKPDRLLYYCCRTLGKKSCHPVPQFPYGQENRMS